MKLKSIIFSIVFACFIFNSNAQTKKPLKPQNKTIVKPQNVITPIVKEQIVKEPVELFKITDLSFFNPQHVSILEKQVVDILAIPHTGYGEKSNYAGSKSVFTGYTESEPKNILDKEFRPIGNDWFYVNKFNNKTGIFRKESESFSAALLDDNNTERALNDSIFLLGDGSLFNIFKNEYLKTDLTKNKRVKIIDLPNIAYETLLYGDAYPVYSQFAETNKYVYDIINFNILSNPKKLFDKNNKTPKIGKYNFSNRFSNYMLSAKWPYTIFNRYNAEETFDLNDLFKLPFLSNELFVGTTKFIPSTYNDSLLIIPVRLNYSISKANPNSVKINFFNLANFLCNSTNEIAEYSIEEFFNYKEAKVNENWKTNDPNSQNRIANILNDKNSDFYGKYLKTVYFQNTYNLIKEQEIFESKDLAQKEKISEKFIDYTPEIIVAYNFHTKKIKLLKRNGLPFKQINKLLIDKSNNLLIVQSTDNKFSVMDLRNGKEIFTAVGIINHISDDNKLMLNFTASSLEIEDRHEDKPKTIEKKINGYAFNLNELLSYNSVYFSGFTENLNIDEFATDESFKAKLAELDKKNLTLFFNQERNEKKLSYANPTLYQPNNDLILDVTSGQIKKFINDQGAIPADIKFPLVYSLWDPNTQIIKLTSELDTSTLKYFNNRLFWSWNHDNDEELALLGLSRKLQKFSGELDKSTINFEIGPVDAGYAKKVKDGSIKLAFILQNNETHIPKYDYIFYNRFLKYEDIEKYKLNSNMQALENIDKMFLINRNSLFFYRNYFMEEDGIKIPLKESGHQEITDGYSKN